MRLRKTKRWRKDTTPRHSSYVLPERSQRPKNAGRYVPVEEPSTASEADMTPRRLQRVSNFAQTPHWKRANVRYGQAAFLSVSCPKNGDVPKSPFPHWQH
jgi:hypothetical protein